MVLTPRRWRQVGDNAYALRLRRWQTSPVTEESAKETVKTIARGMPGVSGVTVVTNACAYLTHHTRLRALSARPAFPAPSFFGVRDVMQNSRERRGEIVRVCL